MARVPLYKAAETEMIRRIRSGEWEPGLRLPNEFGLADEFGVSQGTMRRALITLEGMGLLHRKPGRGTIVADPSAATPTTSGSAIGFDRLLGADGQPADIETFRSHATTRGASSDETALFGTTRLSNLERTLRLGSARVGLEETVLPEALAPALAEDAPLSLADLLATLGHSVARMDDQLSASVTSMGDSVALAVDRHTGLLVLVRTAYAKNGTPLARQTLRLVTGAVAYGITLTG